MPNEHSWLDLFTSGPAKFAAGAGTTILGVARFLTSRKDEAYTKLEADNERLHREIVQKDEIIASQDSRMLANDAARLKEIGELRASSKTWQDAHDFVKEAFTKLRERSLPRKIENTQLHRKIARVHGMLESFCADHSDCTDPEFIAIRVAVEECAAEIVVEKEDVE